MFKWLHWRIFYLLQALGLCGVAVLRCNLCGAVMETAERAVQHSKIVHEEDISFE